MIHGPKQWPPLSDFYPSNGGACYFSENEVVRNYDMLLPSMKSGTGRTRSNVFLALFSRLSLPLVLLFILPIDCRRAGRSGFRFLS